MPEDTDLLRLENQLCFSVVLASRAVLGLYRPLLEPLGLTHPQYLVLLALWERDPRTVTDLSHTLQLDKATLSPLLKRLEASGYITRQRNSADERALDIRLSDSGRALRAEAERIPVTIMSQLGMTPDQLSSLRGTLTSLSTASDNPQPDSTTVTR